MNCLMNTQQNGKNLSGDKGAFFSFFITINYLKYKYIYDIISK